MRREWTEWEVRYLEKKYVGQPVERTAERLKQNHKFCKTKSSEYEFESLYRLIKCKGCS